MAVELKVIARRAAGVFGGTPKVIRYKDDAEINWVDILSCADRPSPGVTSYATIGMSCHDNQMTSGGKPLRVELLGASDSHMTKFADMLSSCAFNVASGQYSLTPGVIFPDIVSAYEPEATMRHMLFVAPFLWGNEPTEISDDDYTVAWLMAVPVSESEFEYARQHGTDALQDRLEQDDANVLDIHRKPVV